MFKDSFKFYKSKNHVDYSTVVDFDTDFEKFNVKCRKIKTKAGTCFGLKSVQKWEIFEIEDRPGLLFIKNPFNTLGQRYWIVRCLQDYSRKPNKRNIDLNMPVFKNVDWWEWCNKANIKFLKKLSWSTLGYHHDWDTKVYSEENKTDFPGDLQDVSRYLAEVLGFGDYTAEAAIINYYQMDSTLSGHTDHSEPNLEAPLFSFSFGQTALFLIGGKSIGDAPVPIFLKSGDILVMAGDSRLCYHGVPRILRADARPWEDNDESLDMKVPVQFEEIAQVCREDQLWTPFKNYMEYSRINMNVRQVLNKNQKILNS